MRCDDVPVWFGAPRCLGDLVAEALHGQRALGRVHDIGLVRRDVRSEARRLVELGLKAKPRAYDRAPSPEVR